MMINNPAVELASAELINAGVFDGIIKRFEKAVHKLAWEGALDMSAENVDRV